MELSSPESIRALLQLYGNPTTERRRSAQPAVRSQNKGRRVNCACGRCPRCLDNARWERIFAEKFADPDYYSQLVTRTSSPLTSV